MTRYLVEVYKIEIPDNGNRRDDITETTEDWLKKDRDFQFQLQGYDLDSIEDRLKAINSERKA